MYYFFHRKHDILCIYKPHTIVLALHICKENHICVSITIELNDKVNKY